MVLLIWFYFVESASATVISSVFLNGFLNGFLPGFFQLLIVTIKGLLDLGHAIISGFGNAGNVVSGVGFGFEKAADIFAMGISGLWTGLNDVAKEMKEASVAIFQVSTLDNIACVVTWAIILMCAPSLAKGVNDLFSKTLPWAFRTALVLPQRLLNLLLSHRRR